MINFFKKQSKNYYNVKTIEKVVYMIKPLLHVLLLLYTDI